MPVALHDRCVVDRNRISSHMPLKRYLSEKSKLWHCPLSLSKNLIDKQSYQPKTLTEANARRRYFLPKFPHQSTNDHELAPLLLANVAGISILPRIDRCLSLCLGKLLKPRELARRLPDAYEDPFNARITGSKQVASISLKMFEENFGSLCTRLHLDRAIVDHNLSRMKDMIDLFISKYRAYLQAYVGEHGLLARADTLKFFTQHEMCLAFEFYLAMDGKNVLREAHSLTILSSSGCILYEILFFSWSTTTTLVECFIF